VIWSISESRTFKRCQRQWYYKSILANAKAKDPLRHKTYLLGKLQSISSWRGQTVDTIISDFIIPSMKGTRRRTVFEAKRAALDLFDRQLAFARKHPLHNPGFSPTKSGCDCVLLHCMEYAGNISEAEVLQARRDVERALENLFELDQLLARFESARSLITQRAICFSHSGVTVRGVPDLIAFYDELPPLIVDWKVHAYGFREAWLQLAVYGLALTLCNPHSDFPFALRRWKVTDISFVEAQLLTKQVRQYTLLPEEVDRAEAYIADSVTQIVLACDDRSNDQLAPTDFPAATSPDTCARCQFRRICWEENGT